MQPARLVEHAACRQWHRLATRGQHHHAEPGRHRRPAADRRGCRPAAASRAMGEALPQGLVYVNDATPGIRRVRRGTGFAYRDASGAWLRDRATLQRIRSLAIPPAYNRVWICMRADGHLQATGRDARGRKQYRYHPSFARCARRASLTAWRRSAARCRGCAPACSATLRPRRATDRRRSMGAGRHRAAARCDLRSRGQRRVRARQQSFGLTTLRSRHAGVSGSVLRLNFRGKSGRQHEVRVDDVRVTRIVRRCQQLPGQELFQFVDGDGVARSVGSGEVNDYLEQLRRTVHRQGLSHLAWLGAGAGPAVGRSSPGCGARRAAAQSR